MDKKWRKFLLIGILFIAVSTAVVIYVYGEVNRTLNFEIYGFSMKSGNSQSQFFLIKTADGKKIVVNGGHNSGSLRKITSVLPFYSRRIDAVIVSDPSSKYVSGLVDIVERYDVGEAYLPLVSSTTDPAYSELQSALKRKNVPMYYAKEGDRFEIGDNAVLDVLFPDSTGQFEYSKSSRPEMVFSIMHTGGRLLFLGNSGKKIQKYVSGSPVLISANANAVGNHAVDVHTVVVLLNLADESDVDRDLFSVLKYDYLIYSKDRTFADRQKINLRQGGDIHLVRGPHGFSFERKR